MDGRYFLSFSSFCWELDQAGLNGFAELGLSISEVRGRG